MSENHININSSTTYQLLKIMLATNTLMAKLTKAYNLYQGLDDSIINKRIAKEWLPFTILGETLPIQNLLIGNLKMKFESMKKNSWVILKVIWQHY